MKIQAVKCIYCGTIIFSRATHDFRSCLCGKINVDGGFDYCKVSAEDPNQLLTMELDLPFTKEELYDDWNCPYLQHYGLLIERNIQTDNGEKKILCHIRPV
jgi:hypothetical protein